MIVILSWYSDSSSKPRLQFFPKDSAQSRTIAGYVASEASIGKQIEIYEIESIELPALLVEEKAG